MNDADIFYLTKAVLALVAAVLLILHMLHIWSSTYGAQQFRYLVLLGYATVTAYASLDQFRSDAPIKPYNVMSAFLTLALIAVVIYSMYDWKRLKRP